MKVKTLRRVVAVAILAIGGVFAGKLISSKGLSKAFAETNKCDGYVCSDIIFGSVHNGGGYTGNNCYGKIEEDGFTIDSFTNSMHHTSDISSLPLKIGGSHNSKPASDKDFGSITINFEGKCDKVMIYAAGWPNDNSPSLTIGNDTRNLPKTNSGVTNPDFVCYTFEFNPTDSIIISNTENKSSNHRVLISKMVFRLYEA